MAIVRPSPARRLLAVVACCILLPGCGAGSPSDGEGRSATTGGSESASDSVPADFDGPPYRAVDELFQALDTAIAAETSVRQESGNLNPPPPAVLDQEYGASTDLRLVIDMRPTEADIADMPADEASKLADEDSGLVFVVYRVDDVLHAEGAEPLAMSEADGQVGGQMLHTLRSDVRTDFQRLGAAASGLDYLGEEDVLGLRTRHYRFSVGVDPEARPNPAILPDEVSGPMPVDLWIGTDGLPVRLDITYREPLAGVPGTGVSRTEYSRWSVPLDFDADDLDWDVPDL